MGVFGFRFLCVFSTHFSVTSNRKHYNTHLNIIIDKMLNLFYTEDNQTNI